MVRSNKYGFSIIELIIVLGIVAIASSLSFASYNYFSAKKELESDVEKFIAVLELAREKARGNDISLCDLSAPDLKNTIVEIISKNKYKLYAICVNKDGDEVPSPISKEKLFSLKKSKFVISDSENPKFSFQNNKGTLDPSLHPEVCVSFEIKGFINDCKMVCVNKVGSIEQKVCPEG